MVNYPLSRGLGNIAKVYLITCSQSTCAKLKKCEFCPVVTVELPIYNLIFLLSNFICCVIIICSYILLLYLVILMILNRINMIYQFGTL